MKTVSTRGRAPATLLLVLGASCAAFALAVPAEAAEPTPRGEFWLVKSSADLAAAPTASHDDEEIARLRRIVAKRTPEDLARLRWWATGGPVHRWNEVILDEMKDGFVVLPLAARHLALFHVALDDALTAARRRPGPASEHAAVAAAAARVLAYLFPARAQHVAALAAEAIQVRLRAGADSVRAVETGSAIGERIAALAIARGRADRSDAVWTGTIPEGPDKWKGVNPIAPAAATWQTWVLATPAEFRPPPPPAIDSDQVRGALAELRSYARTPKSNHRATYWEVHGGARAHTLWNEIARTKLLEHGTAPATAARVMSALNVALADAGVACWDAKYAYWYLRPPQLDAELKPLFAPPNHPSYPAAHGCFSTAAATVLARIFPLDAARLRALGDEAAEARVWAGIHYRFDIDAGTQLGRKVAERTLARAFVERTH